MQNIPASAREAAQIEGATSWEYFWKITFSYVSPFILANMIFTVIDEFTSPTNQVMERIHDMQSDMKYGEAAAMAWTYFAIVLIAVGIITAIITDLFIMKQIRGEQLWRIRLQKVLSFNTDAAVLSAQVCGIFSDSL